MVEGLRALGKGQGLKAPRVGFRSAGRWGGLSGTRGSLIIVCREQVERVS